MKFLIILTIIALSFNVYAGKKSKKVKKIMHDKEHHHVKIKADQDHVHDETHHQAHDHIKHHPKHTEDMKKDGDKHSTHSSGEEVIPAEVKK